MRFTSRVSTHSDTGVALDEVLDETTEDTHLAVVFASPHHTRRARELMLRLQSALPDALVIGCTGSAVIGGGNEIEGEPGLALTLASLPGVGLHPFAVPDAGLPLDAEGWRELLGPGDRAVLALPDPFTSNFHASLPALTEALPGVPVVGGQCSGAAEAGAHALICGDRVLDTGTVGVALSGPVAVDTVVAQGCRPVGAPMFVTRCDRNRIHELDGNDPIEVLRALHESLPEADRELFEDQMFLGIQMRDQEEYQAGDFLIRNVLGIPKVGGGLAVAFKPERFQIVQIHLRDAAAARADLTAVLDRHATESAGRPDPRGALLFTCVGRGKGLYGHTGHDSDRFRERFGEVPLGGFFCNGEIGPVQGQPFVHGYTSVFALFRQD